MNLVKYFSCLKNTFFSDFSNKGMADEDLEIEIDVIQITQMNMKISIVLLMCCYCLMFLKSIEKYSQKYLDPVSFIRDPIIFMNVCFGKKK